MSPEVQRFTTALRLSPQLAPPPGAEAIIAAVEPQTPSRPEHEGDTSTWD